MHRKIVSTEWLIPLVASILFYPLILLTSCAGPTAVTMAPPDQRLTAPCDKPSLPDRITPRRLGQVLVDVAQVMDECNANLKILRQP